MSGQKECAVIEYLLERIRNGNEVTMKTAGKLLAFLVAVALLAAFCGCSLFKTNRTQNPYSIQPPRLIKNQPHPKITKRPPSHQSDGGLFKTHQK